MAKITDALTNLFNGGNGDNPPAQTDPAKEPVVDNPENPQEDKENKDKEDKENKDKEDKVKKVLTPRQVYFKILALSKNPILLKDKKKLKKELQKIISSL